MPNANTRRIQLAPKKNKLLAKLNKENLVKLIFPKAATMGMNLIYIGPRVILRSAFQILRTNIWTRLLSTVLLLSIDLYRFFRKKISKKQLGINLILSLSLLASGTVGWLFGTNSVLEIVAENTVIWILAGLAGAGAFSAISDQVCRLVLGRFFQSDVEDMVDIINEEFESMVTERTLEREEADAIAGKIHVTEKTCLTCFCKADRKKYAREILTPYFILDHELLHDGGSDGGQ